MGYRNEKAPHTGSLLVGTGGKVSFTGRPSGDMNKIATWGEEGGQIESTNFSDLLALYEESFAVSIVSEDEPSLRPLGEDLKLGDLWYSTSERSQYVFTNGIDDLPVTSRGWTPIISGISTIANGFIVSNGIIVGVASTIGGNGDGSQLINLPAPSITTPIIPTTRLNGDTLQSGDLWYNSSELRQYTYYNDGISAQWVPSTP